MEQLVPVVPFCTLLRVSIVIDGEPNQRVRIYHPEPIRVFSNYIIFYNTIDDYEN